MLKWVFRKWVVGPWTVLMWPRIKTVGGLLCMLYKEPSGSIKFGEFLDYLRLSSFSQEGPCCMRSAHRCVLAGLPLPSIDRRGFQIKLLIWIFSPLVWECANEVQFTRTALSLNITQFVFFFLVDGLLCPYALRNISVFYLRPCVIGFTPAFTLSVLPLPISPIFYNFRGVRWLEFRGNVDSHSTKRRKPPARGLNILQCRL